MSGKQYVGVLVLSGILSLLGSSFLSRVVWPDTVTAQPGHRGLITTKGIQLVDDAGKARASLILWDGEHPALILSDKACDRRVSISVFPRGRAGLALETTSMSHAFPSTFSKMAARDWCFMDPMGRMSGKLRYRNKKKRSQSAMVANSCRSTGSPS